MFGSLTAALCSGSWAESARAKSSFGYISVVLRAGRLQIKSIKKTDRAAATASFRNIKLLLALTAQPRLLPR